MKGQSGSEDKISVYQQSRFSIRVAFLICSMPLVCGNISNSHTHKMIQVVSHCLFFVFHYILAFTILWQLSNHILSHLAAST